MGQHTKPHDSSTYLQKKQAHGILDLEKRKTRQSMRRLLIFLPLLLAACGVTSANSRPTALPITPTARLSSTEIPYPEPLPEPTRNPFEGAVPTPRVPLPIAAYPAPLQVGASVTVRWIANDRIEIVWSGTAPACLFRQGGGLTYSLTCTPGLLRLPPPAPIDSGYFPRPGDVYIVSDDLTDPPDAKAELGPEPDWDIFYRFFPIMVK